MKHRTMFSPRLASAMAAWLHANTCLHAHIPFMHPEYIRNCQLQTHILTQAIDIVVMPEGLGVESLQAGLRTLLYWIG